jgi:hypothetical protein
MGDCFLWEVLKKYRSSPHFNATFFLSIHDVLIFTNLGWAKFWATFSKTLPVSLSGGIVSRTPGDWS